MLRLAAGPDELSIAALALVTALAANDGEAAIRALRPFSVNERLMIGVEALENGADLDSVRLAINAAAVSPAEVEVTQKTIEMEPLYRSKFMPWWKSTTAKVVGAVAAGVIGWMLYQRQQKSSTSSIR